MPFRAAKQPVWHCNMACFAGRYGPFGIACPRRFATRCMPAGWPMRPRPMPMASAMLPSGRAGPLQPGLRVAFGSAWRSRRAVGTGCPRWRPVSSWGCLRRLPRWPWCRGHQASRGLGAVVTRPAGRLRGGRYAPLPVAHRRRARVCCKKNTICLRIFTPFFFENPNDWITFATVID